MDGDPEPAVAVVVYHLGEKRRDECWESCAGALWGWGQQGATRVAGNLLSIFGLSFPSGSSRRTARPPAAPPLPPKATGETGETLRGSAGAPEHPLLPLLPPPRNAAAGLAAAVLSARRVPSSLVFVPAEVKGSAAAGAPTHGWDP